MISVCFASNSGNERYRENNIKKKRPMSKKRVLAESKKRGVAEAEKHLWNTGNQT